MTGRSRTPRAATLAACLLLLSGCAQAGASAPGTAASGAAAGATSSDGAAAGSAGPDASAGSPVTPTVVEACPAAPAAPDDAPGPSSTTAAAATASASARTDGGLAAGPATVPADPDIEVLADPGPATLPVQVRSCDGELVTVEATDRILAVDLHGTLAEIVFSLGLGDQVVGRDTSTGFEQAAHLPVVTPGGHDLNAEAVLALDPTVVLTDTSIGPPEVQQQLRDAGVAVVFLEPARTVAGVGEQVRTVARVLGVQAAGEQVAGDLDDALTQVLADVPDDGPAPRVAFLYVRGTAGVYLLAGPGSGADELIRAVGGVDVGTDIGLDRAFVPLTSEALVGAEPDVLLVMTGGLESVGGVDGLLQLPGMAQTPAGEARRVVSVDDTEVLTFGPRLPRLVERLSQALHR
ncbi:heme/hemin ABC transporter substrate-binding protein [Aquipuribacter sp. MA13-6]|uniref:heme/hemin ABC transporter substrate-binding protein n=1 Tax=unclassified Aquipuribacter TaxID=2635084 RepID=UPI003EEA5A19